MNMNREDIIRMAREARWIGNVEGWTFNGYEELERFAAMVAAHEREQCAYECEVRDGTFGLKNAGKFFADIIRARGEV